MTTKLKALIGTNLLLLAFIAVSVGYRPNQKSGEAEKKAFAILDTASVEGIHLGKLYFKKEAENLWTINGQYEASQERMQTLLTLLNRVEVKRPVFSSEVDSLNRTFQNSGLQVSVDQNGLTTNFLLLGGKEETYGKKGDEIVVLNIPGFFINLYELLSADLSAWRDRKVLLTTWRTLKRLKVEYPEEPKNSFRIDFNEGFYSVEGVSELDTASLYQYITQFESFQVEEFLTQNRPGIDPSATPFSKVRVEDIYTSRNNTLSIYPTDSLIYGYSEKDQQWVTIDPRSVQDMLLRKEFFEVRKQ